MSTIEIQEPEVKPAKPASRQMAAILPSSDIIWGPALPPKTMFSDSLLEFGVQRKRKFFATTTSLMVNGLAIVAMLIIPLAFPEALPKAQLLTFLVAPPPPPPPPPPAAAEVQHVVRQIQTDMLNNGALRTPTKIPQKIQMIKEEEAPPDLGAGVPGGVPGGIPGGSAGGVMGGILSSTQVAVPKIATPQRVRVSTGVATGLLIKKVTPNYPQLAKQARIQGSVVLQAEISKDGTIQNLQLISGHPMLAPAAIEAVKQWRYKPYLLNGEPVAVETQVVVNFSLSGS